MLRSLSVAAVAVIVGCSLITACSSGSSNAKPAATTQPSSAPSVSTVPVDPGPTPTPAQLAFQKPFLAGEGAPLVDFVRKSKPLSGPKVPPRAVCLDLKNRVLPSVSTTPGVLDALAKKLTDVILMKRYNQALFWLNGLVEACSRTVLPDLEPGPLSVVFGMWSSLAARLGLYGFTV